MTSPVTAASTAAPARSEAERRHYEDFLAGPTPRSGPTVLVLGNCQAESVRLLLDSAGTATVRVPPVFELDAHETALLHRWVGRADALVTQPVRADYRGLPLGTAQLADLLPVGGRLVTYPVVRYLGLHPWHVVAHHGLVDGRVVPLPPPPVVPYHDLRVVAAAVGEGETVSAGRTDPVGVRRVASASLAELRRREDGLDVRISWELERPGPDHMRTVNHPGNPVLLALAAGVASALGVEPPADPGRPLLDSVHAPLEASVAECWGLPASATRTDWVVDGRSLPTDVVRAAHLEWYAARRGVAGAVWDRHRETVAALSA